MEQGGDVFRNSHFELIRDCEFPVVKYKYIDIWRYEQRRNIFEYIRQNTEYDVGIIERYMDILEKMGMFRFACGEILEFAKKYPENLYLYGHGEWAKRLESFLNDNHYHIKGYIVSEPVQEKEHSLDEMDNFTDKGIIVALGEKAFSELRETITGRIPAEHCLLPKE
jgi:hypothetical protein